MVLYVERLFMHTCKTAEVMMNMEKKSVCTTKPHMMSHLPMFAFDMDLDLLGLAVRSPPPPFCFVSVILLEIFGMVDGNLNTYLV